MIVTILWKNNKKNYNYYIRFAFCERLYELETCAAPD